MRAVIQRVSRAKVISDGQLTGAIEKGFVVLLGIEHEDTEEDIEWLSAKIAKMRVFSDAEGLMNLALEDVGGDILLVSQFTLHAATKKGNRPSFIKAAKPEQAKHMYEQFKKHLLLHHSGQIEEGVFGAHMAIDMVNDGPVTIIIDSKQKE